MKNPRNVNWTLADLKYERVPLQDKFYYGDLRNPREVTQERLKEIKFNQTEAGIRKRRDERLRGLLRGES